MTVGDSLVNPGLRNIDSRRHSSPSLSPSSHQLNRHRGVTSPPHIVSRPLTSPPPLIPSPARDPEKSRHISKDAKSPVQRENERGRTFSTDRYRQQASRDTDKGRVSSQDQASKDSDKNRSSRETAQKDSDKSEIPAKEPEKRRTLSRDPERGRPPSRDPEKGRQVNRDSEKGRQASRESSNRETDKSKSSSRDSSYKDTDKSKSLSRDAGLRDSEKQRQHSRETGKDSGQGKDRPSSRDSDKGRPSSRDSSYRSLEKNKDSASGKDSNPGSQSKQAGGEGKSPRLAPAISGQSSPPVGTAALTCQQRSGSAKQTDKQGKHGVKELDVSAGMMPRHRATPTSSITQSKDKLSSGKESSSSTGNVMPASLYKDSVVGKSMSPQPSFQKSNSRKSIDHSSGPTTTAPMKPVWSSRTPAEEDVVKRGSMLLALPATALAAKDKHPKVKTTGSREASKDREREKTLQNSNSSNKSPLLNNNTKATGSTNAHAATNPSAHNSSNSKAPVFGNSTKAQGKAQGEKLDNPGGDRSSSKGGENYSCPERKNSSSLENLQQLQQGALAPEKGVKTSAQSHTKPTTNQLPLSSREKKRSVKPPTVTALIKTDPNGTGKAGSISSSCPTTTTSTVSSGHGTRRSARSALFSSPSASSSDSSESDTQTHTEEEDLRKEHSHSELQDHHSLLTQGTEDEGPEDNHDRCMDDKHHEDDSDGSGSAKRRYPRRSARARSNMFFGLTPFYGVRSYGEEDLPFYGSGDGTGPVVKRRSGGRKKSAEGQVDGADDMSTSSSSSVDSGDDEDSEMKQRGKDPYYYNFTRTIINPGEGLPSIEGIDQCLGRGSQLQRFLKDEEQQQQMAQGKAEEDMLSAL